MINSGRSLGRSRRTSTRGLHCRGSVLAGKESDVPDTRQWLFGFADDETANARVWAERFSCRARGLDCRKAAQLERLRRRRRNRFSKDDLLTTDHDLLGHGAVSAAPCAITMKRHISLGCRVIGVGPWSRLQRASPCCLTKLCCSRVVGPSDTTICGIGACYRAAGTSPRWKNRSNWSRTSGSFSGP